MEHRFKHAMGVLALAGVALPAPALGAQQQGCLPSYDVEATVDVDQGLLQGRLAVDLSCPEGLPDEVLLWLYPQILAEPPEQLDAMNTYWIYPHHFQPGGIRVAHVQVDGEDPPAAPSEVDLGADHPLSDVKNVLMSVALPADAGTHASITLSFSVKIPKRYGLFGRAAGGLLLASYYHPVVAARGSGGWDLTAPPPAGPYRVSLTLPGDVDAMVGHRFVPATDGGEERTVQVKATRAAMIPIAAYPRLHTTTVNCNGVTLSWYGLRPRPEPQDYEPGDGPVLGITPTIPDVMTLDRPWHVLEVTCRTVELLAHQGHPVPAGQHIRIVEAPLRLELASSTDGFVVVSDRMFDILPIRRAWKFHEFALVRSLVAHLVRRGLPEDVDVATAVMSADFVAASMVGRYARRHHGSQEDMRDILKYGAFLAAIDYFIYSPLVQFRESYFSTVAEKDWLREECWSFPNLLPRGKLYHEKLVDLVGVEAAGRVADRFLDGQGSIRLLAEQEADEDLDWFFSQWSVAYPSLNYRVTGVESTGTKDGGYVYEARIERQGDTHIREPVTVRFVLAGGAHEDRVWDESGPSTTLTLTSKEKLQRVVVDPDMRLFEDSSLTDNHPRFDNFSKPYWRPPVFSNLAITSNITDLTGDLDIVFDMRPKFDVLNSIRFHLLVTTWGQGGAVSYTRGFGPKLDLNSSTWHAGLTLGAFHHGPDFGFSTQRDDGSLRWHGGTSVSASVYIGHDNRFYFFNPTSGWSWWLRVGYGLGIDDPLQDVARTLRHSVSVSTRAFGLWTPSGGHTFALYGGASGNFGDPYRGQLQSLSTHEILRGFDVDETFGRVRLYMCAEYRHVFTHALNWNVLNYTTVQGIQGVLFVGAGTVTDESSYRGLFSTDRIFTEVGYGLRAILAYFGAYPGILALDLAVPITPLDRPGRLPVALRVAFNHVF